MDSVFFHIASNDYLKPGAPIDVNRARCHAHTTGLCCACGTNPCTALSSGAAWATASAASVWLRACAPECAPSRGCAKAASIAYRHFTIEFIAASACPVSASSNFGLYSSMPARHSHQGADPSGLSTSVDSGKWCSSCSNSASCVAAACTTAAPLLAVAAAALPTAPAGW